MSNTTTSKPRVIDPAILALREQHKANVLALRAKSKSAETLKRIESMLTSLSTEDASKLRMILAAQ